MGEDAFDEPLNKSVKKKEKPNIYAQDLKIKKLFLKYSNGEENNPD